MNITKAQLKTQYERAKSRGWIPHFQEAANTITKGYFDTADLMAIGSRESNLDPKWLTKPGDHGNGFGLMQADKRSFPEFTKTEAWKDARTGILFGAKVLMQKWHDNQTGIGLKRGVQSSKTKRMSYFVGKDIGQGAEAQRVAIASYNAGRWPAYAVANGSDPDRYTTGKDYSQDVIARAKVFRELLAKDFPTSSAAPAETPSDKPDAQVQAEDQGVTSVTANQPPIQVEAEIKQPEVSGTAQVSQPEPYMGVGFWAVVKRDLKAATGGNLSLAALAEYAQQASGWPEWVVGIIQKLAVGVLIATLGYFVFRIVHYFIDTLKKNSKTKIEAEAATANDRKDIEWI